LPGAFGQKLNRRVGGIHESWILNVGFEERGGLFVFEIPAGQSFLPNRDPQNENFQIGSCREISFILGRAGGVVSVLLSWAGSR
jgi:hypothetical protein